MSSSRVRERRPVFPPQRALQGPQSLQSENTHALSLDGATEGDTESNKDMMGVLVAEGAWEGDAGEEALGDGPAELVGDAKHACMLQTLVSIHTSHGFPFPKGNVRTERVRFIMPPPHGCEHDPNADHSLITQSSEQTPSSQPRSSYVPFTQIDPNPLAVVRLRCCNPKPHVLPFPPLHVLHAVHSLYAHGQSMSLQGLVSTVTFDGHTAPPFAAAITTVRVRVMVPSPHAIEQTEKAVHSLIKQSTGHRWVLHVW
jgi:hypothetical protein